ncbi:MAG: hypothetical protein NZT61_05280 [Deltaproteobacteria bacterium]|nr:hypothetical protein [Deltaproteobacteria bacterium]
MSGLVLDIARSPSQVYAQQYEEKLNQLLSQVFNVSLTTNFNVLLSDDEACLLVYRLLNTTFFIPKDPTLRLYLDETEFKVADPFGILFCYIIDSDPSIKLVTLQAARSLMSTHLSETKRLIDEAFQLWQTFALERRITELAQLAKFGFDAYFCQRQLEIKTYKLVRKPEDVWALAFQRFTEQRIRTFLLDGIFRISPRFRTVAREYHVLINRARVDVNSLCEGREILAIQVINLLET